MGRYILRRSLLGVATLLLVMFVLHLLTTFAIQLNGNPALAFFGEKVPTQEQLAAVETRFGLGMGLGTMAARRRDRSADHGIRLTSVLIDAFPIFVLLLVYRYVFAVPLSDWAEERFGDGSLPALWFRPSFDADHPWATLLVPGVLLGLAGSAAFIRLVRASQLESYSGEHVRTARAKGLPERHVITHHVVRNSSVPVVTAVGLTFADALGGAVITEGLMNIYGMGGVLWEAVRASDVSLVVGVVTILAMVTVAVMLLVDLAYAALDPRIRYD